ncbi:hypothetical protein ACIFOT_19335 [Neobacillus sp. NRS-1170]
MPEKGEERGNGHVEGFYVPEKGQEQRKWSRRKALRARKRAGAEEMVT